MNGLSPRVAFQRFLRSRLVWRLSGLSWWSACKATKGKVMDRAGYLAHCAGEMDFIMEHLRPGDRVLEFGCGLGGNAHAVAGKVARMVGVDINGLYIRWARRVNRDRPNTEFIAYDGMTLPFEDGVFSLVYSWAVFERLPKDLVESYLKEFCRVLEPGGRTAVYFLRRNALETGFSELLGDDIYVFWEQDELRALHVRLGLTVQRIIDWPNAWSVMGEKGGEG